LFVPANQHQSISIPWPRRQAPVGAECTLLRHAFHTSAMTSTEHRYDDKKETILTWNGRMCIGTVRDLSLGCGLDRRCT